MPAMPTAAAGDGGGACSSDASTRARGVERRVPIEMKRGWVSERPRAMRRLKATSAAARPARSRAPPPPADARSEGQLGWRAERRAVPHTRPYPPSVTRKKSSAGGGTSPNSLRKRTLYSAAQPAAPATLAAATLAAPSPAAPPSPDAASAEVLFSEDARPPAAHGCATRTTPTVEQATAATASARSGRPSSGTDRSATRAGVVEKIETTSGGESEASAAM
mmetsp:Transcript_43396/g.137234  ORF Transcript_43396/g.137234 Transcript_43396/m.137234 type:complete len:221 (+) Transcript_43396:223-885(+)